MCYRTKIPTRHNTWTVELDLSWNRIYFFVSDKETPGLYRQQNTNSVPKTIWKKIRSFLKDPKRFGRRYFS